LLKSDQEIKQIDGETATDDTKQSISCKGLKKSPEARTQRSGGSGRLRWERAAAGSAQLLGGRL